MSTKGLYCLNQRLQATDWARTSRENRFTLCNAVQRLTGWAQGTSQEVHQDLVILRMGPGPRNKLCWMSRPEVNTDCVTWAKSSISCTMITVSAGEQVMPSQCSRSLGYLDVPQTKGTREASIHVGAGVPTPVPFNHSGPAFIPYLGGLPNTALEKRHPYLADDNTVPSKPENS